MNPRWKIKTVLLIVTAIVTLMMFSGTSFGQCAMCRTSLAGSNNAFFIRNFNIGVLVLLIPPVTIFCSIFIALKRYRAADEEQKEGPRRDPETEGRRPQS